MARIAVNEKDISWYYRQREAGAVTVYVPGIATFGPEKPVYCDSSNFSTLFGNSPVALRGDISYLSAASYINSGFNVIFHRFVPTDATAADAIVLTYDELAEDLVIGDPDGKYKIPFAKGSTSTVISSIAYETINPHIGNQLSNLAVGPVTISAKYKGSFGNSLKVVTRGSGDVRYFYVYNTATASLLETLTVNFTDPTDANYYSLINEDSNFLTFKLAEGEIDFKTVEVPSEMYLSGGFDGDPETMYSSVVDAIATPGSLKALKDPYQFTFDVITDGGFNNYNDGVRAYLDRESWTIRFTQGLPSAVTVVLSSGEVTVPAKATSYKLSNNVPLESASKDVKAFNDYFSNNDAFGSFSISSMSIVDSVLADLAGVKGNAIYLVAGAADWNDEEFYAYCGHFNTSYAAGFGPWGYAQFTANGVQSLLPGSYAMLVAWANSCSVGNPMWMAPAGVKRAQLGSFYKAPKYEVDSTILDSWQNQEYVGVDSDYKVNPIMKLKSYGYCIYGNSTLLHSKPDGSTSMLQSFSVRVLANQIKTHAFDVSLSLQFDQLTDDLFAQFKTLMTVYMDQLRYQGALYDYQLVVDRSALTLADLNTKTVPVRIMISPNPAAENFNINLEITQAGVSFNDDTDETEVA